MRLIGRKKELAWLRSRYESDRAEFLVMYGRRRVGKSALVRASVEGRKDAVYYQARETSPKLQLEDFVETASRLGPDLQDVRPGWEPLLKRLAAENLVIIIDEFPYLIASDPSIPSTFQRTWDLSLQNTTSTLVLVGSSLGIMEDKVLAGGSPLFGRRTGSLDLAPFNIWETAPFYPGWSAESRILSWSVFGGMPHALQHIKGDQDLGTNIQELVLEPGGPLHEEGVFLLHQEFTQPATYLALIEAVVAGKGVPHEIADKAGIDAASIGTYLRKLVRTRILEREIPVTEDPSRSKKGRYRLADPFLDFWFRFVHGRRTQLALSGPGAARRIVEGDLQKHASSHFERVCVEALPRLIPRPYTRIGRWWHNETEIDVVGLTDSPTLVVGEAKFSSQPVGTRLLHELEQKAEQVRWTPPSQSKPRFECVLFSRSGFAPALQEEATHRDDVHLFDLEQVLGAPESQSMT